MIRFFLILTLVVVLSAMSRSDVTPPEWSKIPEWAQSTIEVTDLDSGFTDPGVWEVGKMIEEAFETSGLTSYPTPHKGTWIWFRMQELDEGSTWADRPDAVEYLTSIFKDYKMAQLRRERIRIRNKDR